MLSYKGFQGHCSFDPLKGIYLSRVVNCEDMILGQGLSPEQAEQSFQYGIDVYLATRRQKGLPPPSLMTIG